jgi:putative membrane protein
MPGLLAFTGVARYRVHTRGIGGISDSLTQQPTGRPAVLDLILTILHHILVFGLAAILATEIAVVRPGIAGPQITRIGSIDSLFGIFAGLVIVVGFARVFFGAKGSEFFLTNGWFWAKMVAFVIVGILSIQPTIRFVGWRARLKADPAFIPAEAEIQNVRRFMRLEAIVFVLIPIFAAIMVRTYAF